MAPPSNPPQPAQAGRSNLATRTLSALALVPVAAAAIWAGWPWFDALVFVFAALMIWEWTRVASGQAADPARAGALIDWSLPGTAPIVLVIAAMLEARLPAEATATVVPFWMVLGGAAATATFLAVPLHRQRSLWFGAGVLYVVIPSLALLWLRDDPATGMGVETLAWVLAVVIATDTGAYAAGRSIGGPKLAAGISPSKTWSGLAGGVVCAALAGLATGLFLDLANIWKLMILSGSLAIVAQAGDLFESAFKRRFGVKDSSHIIPGHGGVLDRVDGLLTVSVAVALLNYFGKGSVLSWL